MSMASRARNKKRPTTHTLRKPWVYHGREIGGGVMRMPSGDKYLMRPDGWRRAK